MLAPFCTWNTCTPQAEEDGDSNEHTDNRNLGGDAADHFENDGWVVGPGNSGGDEEGSRLAAQALFLQQQVAGPGAGSLSDVHVLPPGATSVSALPAVQPIETPQPTDMKQQQVAAPPPKTAKKKKRAKKRRRPDSHKIELEQKNPFRKTSARFERYETCKSAKTMRKFKELAGKSWSADIREIGRRGTADYPFLEVFGVGLWWAMPLCLPCMPVLGPWLC